MENTVKKISLKKDNPVDEELELEGTEIEEGDSSPSPVSSGGGSSTDRVKRGKANPISNTGTYDYGTSRGKANPISNTGTYDYGTARGPANPLIPEGLSEQIKKMKKMMLIEEKEKESDKMIEFAEKRLAGAEKIVNNAKEKGGPAMLTYHHFIVKLPYYRKVAKGNFDYDATKKELQEKLDILNNNFEKMKLQQIPFQKLVGEIEVLGELLIFYDKEKKSD